MYAFIVHIWYYCSCSHYLHHCTLIISYPQKIQKTYQRASAANKGRLQNKENEWLKKSAPLYLDQMEHAMNMLQDIQRVLPKYKSKIISDLPLYLDMATGVTKRIVSQSYYFGNITVCPIFTR